MPRADDGAPRCSGSSSRTRVSAPTVDREQLGILARLDAHVSVPRLPIGGELLGGKYRIVRQLGQGGMGAVFEAQHAKLGHRVAIKMLHPRLLEQPEVLSRFEREARAASSIRGRHVGSVIDVDVTPKGAPYIVMEYFEGNDLAMEIGLRGRLPIHEAVDYVLQACWAMTSAHALGIIHRDLKPSNLFLAREGSARVLKVLDFGISKVTSDADALVTSTTMSIGTPVYMSPEQIRSAKHVDARTDVWALGVILYELVAGCPPFTGSTTAVSVAICMEEPTEVSILRSEVAPPLARAIMRALSKGMAERFQDVGSFAEAIAPYASPQLRDGNAAELARARIIDTSPTVMDASLGDAATVAARASSLPNAASAPRRPMVASAVVVALILAAGVAAVLLRSGSAPRTQQAASSAIQVGTPSAPPAATAPVASSSAAPSSSSSASAPLVPVASAPKVGAPKPSVTPKVIATTPTASPAPPAPPATTSTTNPIRL